MDTQFAPRYWEFRDRTLTLDEVESLRAQVKNMVLDHASGFKEVTHGTTERRFKVYLYLSPPALTPSSVSGVIWCGLANPSLVTWMTSGRRSSSSKKGGEP